MAEEKSIIERLTIIDETAARPVTTDLEKQHLIQELSAQVEELRQMVLMQIDDDTHTKDAEISSMKIGQAKLKNWEEDIWQRWRLCSCDQYQCMTCLAEEEAKASAKAWFDNPVSIPEIPPLELIRISEVTGLDEKGRCPCGSYNYCDETRQVAVDVDHFYTEEQNTNRYIIWLHPKLSASDSASEIGHQYCRGLVTFQVAAKMISAKQVKLFGCHVKGLYILFPETFEIISHSIAESQKIYTANYKDNPRCLTIEDIVLLNSDLGISLKEEFEVQEVIADVLVSYIMNLKHNELLLFVRMEPYNVWSALSREKDIVIFDYQQYDSTSDSGEKRKYGGVIYNVWKWAPSVRNTLDYIRYISGPFYDCRVGVIQIDTPYCSV